MKRGNQLAFLSHNLGTLDRSSRLGNGRCFINDGCGEYTCTYIVCHGHNYHGYTPGLGRSFSQTFFPVITKAERKLGE